MSDLIVIGYPDKKATTVWQELVKLQEDYLVDLEDAAIIRRDQKGKLHVTTPAHHAVACRVEEHPEGRTWLVGVLRRAEIEHCHLGGVEVVDNYVEMHLLWQLLGRPSRRDMALDLLKGDALTAPRSPRSPASRGATPARSGAHAAACGGIRLIRGVVCPDLRPVGGNVDLPIQERAVGSRRRSPGTPHRCGTAARSAASW